MKVQIEIGKNQIGHTANLGRMGPFWFGAIRGRPDVCIEEDGIVTVNFQDDPGGVNGRYQDYCWTTDGEGDPLFKVWDRLA